MKLLKLPGSSPEDDGLNDPRKSLEPNPAGSTTAQDGSPASGTSGNTVQESKRDGSGVILKWQTDLFEHGRRRAIESGALTPQEADLAALEAHASSIAREAQRKLFDPTKIGTHDHLRDNEHQKNLRDREEAELAVKFANADLREREAAVAQAYPGDAPTDPSLMLRASAVVAIMISSAPTLHDFVFVMSDDFFAWLLSVLCGLFLGLWITLMILGDLDAGGRRTATNWIGLGSGIFVSLALGALRLKGASSFGDVLFAVAMTVLELGIVLGLESIAASRRARYMRWHERKTTFDQETKRLEMAQTHLGRCDTRLKALKDAIAAHIGYVEERAVRFLHIDQIEATLLKAVRDGYHAGIAQNRGRILGIKGGTL